MPAYTGQPQPATTQLLLKYGVKAGVLHQEKVFILMPAVSCSFLTLTWQVKAYEYGAG